MEAKMTTIFEYETLDYSKDLGPLFSNYLLSITFLSTPKDDESESEKSIRERKLIDKRLELVGALATIKRRMQNSGHPDDASKIGQLLDIATDQDASDQSVCDTFYQKEDELFPPSPAFEEAVVKIDSQ